MMFSKEDFELGDFSELVKFLPILIFVALVAPFVIAAYKLGFVMEMAKKLD